MKFSLAILLPTFIAVSSSSNIRGRPEGSLQDLIVTSCPQFDCSNVDSSSLECTLDKPKNGAFHFGSNTRPEISKLTEAEKKDLKSELQLKKEERRQKLLSCVCCGELSLDEVFDEEGDGSRGFGGTLSRPSAGGNSILFGGSSSGSFGTSPTVDLEGGTRPQGNGGGRPGMGQASGRPQGLGFGGSGSQGQGSFMPGSGGEAGSGRPQGSGMNEGQGSSGSFSSETSGGPGMGGVGSQEIQGSGMPGQGSSRPGQEGSGESQGPFSGNNGTVDCSGIKLVKTISGRSSTCDGFADQAGGQPFHLWPVGVSADYCHGWSGISSRDGKEHVNSANNLRCSADGTKLLYTQHAGSIDCNSALNPNGVEKEFVLGECHQGIPAALYDMGVNLDCCSDPFGKSCMSDFTGTPMVPENEGVTDVAIWLNGKKCDLSGLDGDGYDRIDTREFTRAGAIPEVEEYADNSVGRNDIALAVGIAMAGVIYALA